MQPTDLDGKQNFVDGRPVRGPVWDPDLEKELKRNKRFLHGGVFKDEWIDDREVWVRYRVVNFVYHWFLWFGHLVYIATFLYRVWSKFGNLS